MYEQVICVKGVIPDAQPLSRNYLASTQRMGCTDKGKLVATTTFYHIPDLYRRLVSTSRNVKHFGVLR